MSTSRTSTTWSGSTPHAMDKTTKPTTIHNTTTKSTTKKTTIKGATESRETTTQANAIKTTKPTTIQKTTPIEAATTKSTTKKIATQGATESRQTTTPTKAIKSTHPKTTKSHRTTESGATSIPITQTQNNSIEPTTLITSTSGKTMIVTQLKSTFTANKQSTLSMDVKTTVPSFTHRYSSNNKTYVTKTTLSVPSPLSTKRKYTTTSSSVTIPTLSPEIKKTTKYETKKPTPKSKITKTSKVENSSHVTQKTKPPTKETTTNKKNILTKTDANKSKQRLSEGAQVGIGISVSLLCVGVVFTVLYIVKNKMRKTAVLQKEETQHNEVGMVTFL